jgi:hypothetical protein
MNIPILSAKKSYAYLGVLIRADLKFDDHLDHLIQTITIKGQKLIDAGLPPRRALLIINRVIKPKIIHSLCIAPFSTTDIAQLDQLLARITRHCFYLHKTFPTNVILCPAERSGIGLQSLMVDYTQICAQTLTRAMNDNEDLGTITRAMLKIQMQTYGNRPAHLQKTLHKEAFSSHGLTLRQISILHSANIIMHTSDPNLTRVDGLRVRRRKRLTRLTYTSPKRAHDMIFNEADADTPHHIESIFNHKTKEYLTDPTAMEEYTHEHFQKAWTTDHTLDQKAPYPFQSVKGKDTVDPFELETYAHHTGIADKNLLPTVLSELTFSKAIRYLSNDKAPGPDNIPNALLKILPDTLKQAIHKLFICLWITGTTPKEWKGSNTIIIHKKGMFAHLENKRPIGLHSSIYKLWTGFVTAIMTEFSETHHILSNSQEGFRTRKNTSRHLQRLILGLEDAKLFDRNQYILFIDFSNAFNTIDHRKLLKILTDLGFPPDAINVIKGIYSDITTQVTLNRATGCRTKDIAVTRGTIQGDRLSPLIFLIYIEPLLRWLKVGGHGYTPSCTNTSHPNATTQDGKAFADDLIVTAPTHQDLLIQYKKIESFCEWSGLQPVGCTKCDALSIGLSLEACPTPICGNRSANPLKERSSV